MFWWLTKNVSTNVIYDDDGIMSVIFNVGNLPVEVDCVGGVGDHDQYLEFDLVLSGDEVLVTYLQALSSHYF